MLITQVNDKRTIDCTHIGEGMYLLKVIDTHLGDFVIERVMVVR